MTNILALKINNCISRNKYEGSGDGELRPSIVHFVHPPTHETDSKKFPSMESDRAGYKKRARRYTHLCRNLQFKNFVQYETKEAVSRAGDIKVTMEI
jgi:hypothetical protein